MCIDVVSFFFILLEVHRTSYLSLISFSKNFLSEFDKFLAIISLVTEFDSFCFLSWDSNFYTLEFLSFIPSFAGLILLPL